jgi:hypothetical protein
VLEKTPPIAPDLYSSPTAALLDRELEVALCSEQVTLRRRWKEKASRLGRAYPAAEGRARDKTPAHPAHDRATVGANADRKEIGRSSTKACGVEGVTEVLGCNAKHASQCPGLLKLTHS